MTPIERSTLLAMMNESHAEFCRAQIRGASGGTIEERDGLLLFALDCEWAIGVSGALRVDHRLAANEMLARAASFFARRYEDRRDHGYTLFTSVEEDADVDLAARAAGLVLLSESPGMVAFERAPVSTPDRIDLREVLGAREVADFAAVSAEAYAGYGMPACVAERMFAEPRSLVGDDRRAFVVYLDGVPASAAMVHLSHRAGYVGWVGTTAAARGRGLAAFVTATVTNAAFDEDARFVWLEATPMGEPVYRRLGYREVSRHRWWVRPPRAQ